MAHWTEDLFCENPELFIEELREKESVAETEVEQILELVRDEYGESPDSVLDVGCGLGRHVIQFAEAGLRGTGIDISDGYLEEARENAERAGVEDRTKFRNRDMRNLDSLDGDYDLGVSLYNSFGYYDAETNRRILGDIRDHLSENGTLVIQISNKDALLYEFTSSSIRDGEFGTVVEQLDFDTETSQLTIARDVLRGERPDLEYQGQTEYSIRLYSPAELVDELRRAGFEDPAIYSTLDGDDVALDYGQMVAVAQAGD
jgi:SAM-dependent methyltransferase